MQTRIGNTESPQVLSDLNSMIYSFTVVQTTASGCCDFIAQCILVRVNHCHGAYYHLFYSHISSKIYRCWIVWGQNIRVVIIPSLLAIAYLGQSIYLHSISRFQFIASSYLATVSWDGWGGIFSC